MNISLKELIQQGESILLFPKQESNLDILFSLKALEIGLSALNKNVDSFIDPSIFSSVFLKNNSLSDLSVTNLNDEKRLVVTLSDFNTKIQNIHWRETSKGKEIIIDTKDKAPQEISIDYKKHRFDVIILVGDHQKHQLEEIRSKYPDQIDSAKTILISNHESVGIEFRNYTFENLSIGQITYAFMREFNIPINKEAAMYIVASIYSGTHNLTDRIDSNTFRSLADLVSQNADLQKAISLSRSKKQNEQPEKLTVNTSSYTQVDSGFKLEPEINREELSNGPILSANSDIKEPERVENNIFKNPVSKGELVEDNTTSKTPNPKLMRHIGNNVYAPIIKPQEVKTVATNRVEEVPELHLPKQDPIDPLKAANTPPKPLFINGEEEEKKIPVDNSPLPPAN
jgi:nanoRNase/pAp phosphatase (c-di-AMP/oligoRNAs hydrolase)